MNEQLSSVVPFFTSSQHVFMRSKKQYVLTSRTRGSAPHRNAKETLSTSPVMMETSALKQASYVMVNLT